ncbi:MAG TPA: branched-chain amino acid ABC transporter permease [Rhodoblastus sp.]|nr:branched-chain amino acid ABC transporter permease [Rhodoblastus sp.]
MLWLQFISGLQTAAVLFLLAAGLSIIYGVCRLLNLAHGSFYMLAMFLAWTVTERAVSNSDVGFLVALIVVPILVAALGAIVEILIFRRLYEADVLVQILPSIGLIFLVADLVRGVWGLESKSIETPSWFSDPIEIMGAYVPGYYLFIICAGAVVAAGVWCLVNLTEWGLLVRATAADRNSAQGLGVNVRWVFTSVFALSTWLVGLAGVLILPLAGANPGSDLDASVDAFAVVVIGGLGSIWGSLAAAMIIGMVKAFGILVAPQFSIAMVFIIMAAVLLVRPAGLFGRTA